MISIGCYEDITMYRFVILEGGTVSDICSMQVIIDGNTYNYYQSKKVIIITNNKIYSDLHTPYSIIPLKRHFELIDLTKKSGNVLYVKINGVVVNDKEYEFVDISRTLKIRQLLNRSSKQIPIS